MIGRGSAPAQRPVHERERIGIPEKRVLVGRAERARSALEDPVHESLTDLMRTGRASVPRDGARLDE